MIPVRQRNKHKPEEGVWGDCHRACIASILDLPYEDVPHFCEGGPSPEEFQKRERAFLISKGYVPIVVAYKAQLDDLLYTIRHMNPNTYYLLAGKSINGTPHSVVCLNDEIVHNPNDATIVGPLDDGYYYITYIGALVGLHT